MIVLSMKFGLKFHEIFNVLWLNYNDRYKISVSFLKKRKNKQNWKLKKVEATPLGIS
jgi:hypothetical protein